MSRFIAEARRILEIPENKPTMEFINCLFDQADEISLPEFYQKYRKRLPMLVVVVGGHNGSTEYDDTPSDTIIRYGRFHGVKRGLAQDPKTKINYISIPIKSKYKFNVIRSHSNKKAGHTLDEILDSNPLPVLVQFSEDQEIPSEGRNREGKPFQFLITHVYEEIFIQGNFITDGKITKYPSSFSLCPLISVAPVKGFTDRPQKEFDKYLKRLETYVNKNTVFSESQCNLAIKVLRPDADELKEVLCPKKTKDVTRQPPPPPARTPSVRKPGNTNDDDDEEYEVVEQPEEDIDTYRLASDDKPNYVNDNLCQVKPLPKVDGDDSDGELYEPMEEQVENLCVSSPTGVDKPGICIPPRPSIPIPPRPGAKPNVPPLENSSHTTKVPMPHPRDKHSSSISNEDCQKPPEHIGTDSKIKETSSFDIAEKSIQDIAEVLSLLHLNKYVARFEEEMVDGELLAELTVEDLQSEFNFSKLEAMRLCKYIEKGHIPK